MIEWESIKEKIKAGTWSAQDASDCVLVLEQEMEKNLADDSDRMGYIKAVYMASYGIFAYSYREHVFTMIDLCQKILTGCEEEKERALLYLGLVRLYFVTGFQPKIVEYGLKYAESKDTNRSDLKSVYNCIAVAFTESGLFEEAVVYFDKMLEVTRKDPCDAGEDFWSSDVINELVYLDSMVYIMLGLGKHEEAAGMAHRLECMIEEMVPEENKEFFCIQKEFTCLYLHMHISPDAQDIADEFIKYMERLASGEVACSGISFCVRYFAEFLEVLLEQGLFDKVVRIGDFLTTSCLFTGSCTQVYRLMLQAVGQSQDASVQAQRLDLEKRYIKALEEKENNCTMMLRTLTKEELRIIRLRKAAAKDSLTGCRNRSAFEREGSRYLYNHPEGTLVFIDLDHLKEVNDKYGHGNGDRYLTQFSEMIEAALGEEELLYRYGGDEFIILSNRGKFEIEALMNELLRKNPILFMLEDGSRPISFSYGIVEFHEFPNNIYGLIREADHRMYLCKKENHMRLLKEGF